MQIISKEQIQAVADWEAIIQALYLAHLGPHPFTDDFFVGDSNVGLFSRGVVLPGVGSGAKVASMRAANVARTTPLPTEHAAFLYIEEDTGAIGAIFDGPAVTRLKTAADSALAGRILSREDSEVLLVIGSGPIARALTEAYLHVRPNLKRVLLWNRSSSKLTEAQNDLLDGGINVSVVDDLDDAVAAADIIVSATATTTPLILGRFVRPGTHVDLVGGYRPDMQEADEELVSVASVYVDDWDSALESGDLSIPLERGIIKATHVQADLFDLCQDDEFVRQPEAITLYKNAGGAHLDLIVCHYLLGIIDASKG